MSKQVCKSREETRITPARPGRLAGLFCLAAATFSFFMLFLVGMQTGAQHVGDTLYLPLVMQPLLTGLPVAKQDVIQWRTAESPFPLVSGQAVTVDIDEKEYLFLIGGGDQIDPQTKRVMQSNRVLRAPLNADGSVGNWSRAGDLQALPRRLHGFTATAVSKQIYVLGGLNYPAGGGLPNFNNIAYCATVNEDGTFSRGWEEANQTWKMSPGNAYDYEDSMAYHAAVFLDGRLYVIGGLRRGLYSNQKWEATRFVFSAAVGESCGNLEWKQETSLPLPLRGHTAVAVPSNITDAPTPAIYLFGGLNNDQSAPVAVSLRANIEDGTLTAWTNQTPVPGSTGVHTATAARSGDYLYFMAGTNQYNPYDGAASNAVYRTKILPDGSLTPWTTVKYGLAHLYGQATAVSKLGRLYVVGGAYIDGPGSPPVPQNKIYWTPLLFFNKESDPPYLVRPGEAIAYRLNLISNNVRDLPNLVIKDTLPHNVALLYAPNFSQAGNLLMSMPITLPINSQTWQMFTAVVIQPTTPASAGRLPNATLEPAWQTTPEPTTAAQPLQANIRPTQVIGCVADDAQIESGTPRPKPTCTPSPAVTPTGTFTATPSATVTATPTPTDTPTPSATPQPDPVLVVNQAVLCFEEACVWQDTAVNAPFRTYLPQVSQ